MDTLTFCIIFIALVLLAVVIFFTGPQLLAAFFKKADEWAEIIANAKDEK